MNARAAGDVAPGRQASMMRRSMAGWVRAIVTTSPAASRPERGIRATPMPSATSCTMTVRSLVSATTRGAKPALRHSVSRTVRRRLALASAHGVREAWHQLSPGVPAGTARPRVGCRAGPSLAIRGWSWGGGLRLTWGAMSMAAYRPSRGRVLGLLGRRAECEVLDRLLAAVRAGESRALVVCGEPGAGKTALLDYLAGQASSCRVAAAAGVQSEMELAFAGLHQLCAPMLGRLERLPGPQRDALRTAFGMSAGPVPDRFMV